jgi:hypothetical protein
VSKILSGLASNVTTPLVRSITALANNGSGAIRATTGVPHYFSTGDSVIVNTPVVVGTFAIVVINATQFDLVGSTFTATSTGTATDQSLTPAILVPTDGDTFSAQISGLLSAFQGVLDRTQYLQQQIAASETAASKQASTALTNWSPEFLAFNTDTQLDIGWDPLTSRWMLIGSNNSTGAVDLHVTYGMDQGASAAWISMGSFTPANTALYGAVSADPTTPGSYWIGYTDGASTHNDFKVEYWNGSSWTQVFNGLAGGYFYGCALATLGGYLIAAVAGTGTVGSGGSDDTFIQVTNNHGGSWSTPVVTGVAAAVNATWLLKSNGVEVLAILSSVGQTTVWYSTDGHTFNSTSSLSSLLSAGDTVVGLAFAEDAVGPCWLAAVNHASGPPSWYRSTAGVNWTPQAGGISTNETITHMAAVGSFVFCTLKDASSGGPSGAIYSVDGGITWYFSQATFTSNTATVYNPSIVRSSGIGLMTMNGLWARFSDLSGLPAVHL